MSSPLGTQGSSSVLDGVGTAARFLAVYCIVIDSSSQVLFVPEKTANQVRRIVITSLLVSIVIGEGTAAMTSGYPLAAQLSKPRGFEFFQNTLYIVQAHGVSKAYGTRSIQTHSPSHSLTHSLTHSLNHSLTHSLTHSQLSRHGDGADSVRLDPGDHYVTFIFTQNHGTFTHGTSHSIL